MNYLEIAFTVENVNDYRKDLLIDGLGEAGYESFMDTDIGFNAYIVENDFSEQILKTAIAKNADGMACAYALRSIQSQNWNALWESNFEPVKVGDKCLIRASFHAANPSLPFEVVINPKMSFGTGHHETTYLMAEYLFDIDCKGKKVLDMGCGTGILAILAAKLGAKEVLAMDIDPICEGNAMENIAMNGVGNVNVKIGDIGSVEGDFDIIIANINRNILLQHLPYYAQTMCQKSTLLLSGFYENSDLETLRTAAALQGLTFIDHKSKNKWAAARFEK